MIIVVFAWHSKLSTDEGHLSLGDQIAIFFAMSYCVNYRIVKWVQLFVG